MSEQLKVGLREANSIGVKGITRGRLAVFFPPVSPVASGEEEEEDNDEASNAGGQEISPTTPVHAA